MTWQDTSCLYTSGQPYQSRLETVSSDVMAYASAEAYGHCYGAQIHVWICIKVYAIDMMWLDINESVDSTC